MKRVTAMLLCASMVLAMTACGNKKTEEASTTEPKKEEAAAGSIELGEAKLADFEYNASDYVTLGEYKGMEVHLSGEYEYSDEGFKTYVNDTMIGGASNAFYEDESQTVVAEDSIVNVDYTGYLDGEAFQGGAATDVLLDIKNNCTPGGSGYIDGFSSGLVGAKVGDVVDCDVTFPENYTAELAGKEVVFRFQVNYICAKASYDDLTDEYVSKVFNYDTVDEFLGSAKEAYESSLEETYNKDLRAAVIKSLMDNCSIKEYPQAVIDARADDYIRLMMNQFGVSTVADLDAAWAANSSMGGATVADYREYVAEQVKGNLDSEMPLLALCAAEGIELSEDDFAAYLKEYLGADSADESLYVSYGSTAEIGEQYLRKIALANLGIQYCIENSTVVVD